RLDRLIKPVLVAQQVAEVEVRLGETRIQFNSPPQAGERFFEPVELPQCRPEVVVRVGQFRRERDRPFKRSQSFVGPPRRRVRRPQMVPDEEEFMKDVLAKKGGYPPRAVESVFHERFPSIHRFVQWFNQEDHGNLIRHLQSLEAWLVIEQVAPRLVKQIPIVTLHDAIFCRAGDSSAVEAAFLEAFEQISFSMKLELEQWGAGCMYTIRTPPANRRTQDAANLVK
ncbi:MAG: hypothetical protein RIC55_34950, partial [Pirellulaceae bacterium]